MFLDHEEWTLITSAMHVIIGMLGLVGQLRTPNNGGRSIVVMPLVVIQADVGSNPIVHPKQCNSGRDGSGAGLKSQILGFDSLGLHQFCDTVGSIPMRCALRWLGIAIKFMLRSSIG